MSSKALQPDLALPELTHLRARSAKAPCVQALLMALGINDEHQES